MAAAVIVFVIAPHVRILQPMHPNAEITVIGGQEDQMKMGWHQGVAQNGHRYFYTGMAKSLEKGMIIAVFMKHLPTTVAALEHMVADTANSGSRGPRHKLKASDRPTLSIKLRVPFSSVRIPAFLKGPFSVSI
jgi:hypothetical protein